MGERHKKTVPLTSRIRAGRVSFSMCRHFPSCWKLSHKWGVLWGNLASSPQATQLQGLAGHLTEGGWPDVCRGCDSGEWESTPSEGDSHFLAPPSDYHYRHRITRFFFFSKRGQVSRFLIGNFPVFKCSQFIQFFKTPCRSNMRPTDPCTIENVRKELWHRRFYCSDVSAGERFYS